MIKNRKIREGYRCESNYTQIPLYSPSEALPYQKDRKMGLMELFTKEGQRDQQRPSNQ
jgi:hypothetical protein